MKTIRFSSFSTASLTLLGSLVVATSVLGDVLTYTGTTAGGPTWNRPIAGTPPTSLSGVGTAVPYSFALLSVSLSGSYVFQSTAAAWDNYSFLYGNAFNPASPLTNALTGNDDNPSIGLSGFTFNLTAGTSYYFVVTGFGNTDFGAFSNTISGPGTITRGGAAAAPEAGPGLLLACLVLAGLAVAHRRPRPALEQASAA